MLTQTYSIAWLCSILYLTSDMGLHYLIFMGRNLENRKKLTPTRIMNSANMHSTNIVNNVGVFNDSVAIITLFKSIIVFVLWD